MRFKHLAIVVYRDIDKLCNFYTKFFGFEIIKKYFRPDLSLEVRLLEKGNLTLEFLFLSKSKARLIKNKFKKFNFLAKSGYNHLCFESNNLNGDFQKLKRNKAVKILVSPTQGTRGKQFFIEDPEGNIIEIYQTDL